MDQRKSLRRAHDQHQFSWVELVVIGTNRDLAAIKQILHREIDRLQYLADGVRDAAWIERELSLLYRQRLVVCAALVNRRIEASGKIVDFARWVSGNGALDPTATWSAKDDARLPVPKMSATANASPARGTSLLKARGLGLPEGDLSTLESYEVQR